MKKLAVDVKRAKANRTEDLEVSRQTLARLKTTQNVLRALTVHSELLIQDQTQTVAVIQTALDKPNGELDLTLKDQYETDLRVRNIFIYSSIALCNNPLHFCYRILKSISKDRFVCWKSCAWRRNTKIDSETPIFVIITNFSTFTF